MSEAPARLAGLADALRRAFDHSFTEEARTETTATEDLLAFRVGPRPYALRLSEIGDLFTGRQITRLPGDGHAAFLGIAGFRGSIVPAYDLGVLLGHPPSERPHWLALAAEADAAFAFEGLEGHVRLARGAITPRQETDYAARPIRDFATIAGSARPIVHLPVALEAIRALLAGGGASGRVRTSGG